MKYILGIESTAHTFGVAVLNFEGEILSNVRDMYTTEEGGMIPLEVRKHHERVAGELFEKALEESGVKAEQLEAIAFSNAPGLAPCLIEGMKFAKEMAKGLGIPLVMVNHCVAHLEIGESIGAKDPVMLYASGANTQIIAYESGKYRVFGETLDLGVGNFIDTVARYMGLGFPGGPEIQRLASESVSGSRCPVAGDLLDLPYSIKGMDVAFSGLQTKIKNLIDKGVDHGEIAYSLQEVVFAMLVEAAERALAHTGKKELLLGGGVACNSRLQEMCKIMCEERGEPDRFAARPGRSPCQTASLPDCGGGKVKLFMPPRELLVDNAGMIGYLGLKMFKAGIFESDMSKVDINARERTDDVEVSWK